MPRIGSFGASIRCKLKTRQDERQGIKLPLERITFYSDSFVVRKINVEQKVAENWAPYCILSIRICDRSAQFLENCFENVLWQQTIADLIQPTCLLVREERQERSRARINRRRGVMWKIYAASETGLLIAEADKVLRYLVMFLPVLLHWSYKMKCNRYQHSLAFLAGLFIGLWLRNAPLDKRNRRSSFKNKLLLVSLIYFTLLDYEKSLNYWMGFRAAPLPVSLSNYIAFDGLFFLVSCLCPHFLHICKI